MRLPHTATIRTLVASGSKYSYSGTATVPCFLQPLDPEYAASIGVDKTKGFKCYVTGTANIVESNQLIINSTKYKVVGVSDYNFSTSIDNKRLILERQ